MSSGRLWVTTLLFCAALLAAGCGGPAARLNAPPQGASERPSDMQDNYVRMVDNAMLAERSMSPAHFVPGSAELNALGVRRLNRYATLLKVYGGPLHYDGLEDDEELAEQRVDKIEQFLTAAGVGPDNFTVDVAVAGGRGMRGVESSEVRRGLSPTATVVHDTQVRVLTEQY